MSNKPAKVKKIQNLESFHSRLLVTTKTFRLQHRTEKVIKYRILHRKKVISNESVITHDPYYQVPVKQYTVKSYYSHNNTITSTDRMSNTVDGVVTKSNSLDSSRPNEVQQSGGNKRSLPRVVTSDEIVENGSSVSSNGSPATMCNERFSTAPNKHKEYARAKKRVRTKTPTPQNVLNSILYDNGMSMLSVSFDKIPKSFFFEQNKDRTACTTTQQALVEAIRRGDLESLHALEFNKLRLRVVDSSGRSPLHDALRSINAHSHYNMELIDKLLKQCPELLFINDSLGKTPLAYVTKQSLVKEFDSYLKSQTSWLTECAIRFALQMTS